MFAQEAWQLGEDEVELVASRHLRSDAAISVISELYNYGAPISGGHDQDFLDIWVAADESLTPRSVSLYGCGTAFEDPDHSDWRDIGEFVKSKTVTINGRSVGLCHFSGPPVAEFVVRVIDYQGNHHYDNNGGYGAN